MHFVVVNLHSQPVIIITPILWIKGTTLIQVLNTEL